MSVRWVRLLLTVNAVVGGVAGAGLLAFPELFLGLIGIGFDQAVAIFARLYGAELIGFNFATWLARDVPSAQRFVVLGHVGNELLTTVVLVGALAAGIGNAFVVGLFAMTAALFTIGYLGAAVTRHAVAEAAG